MGVYDYHRDRKRPDEFGVSVAENVQEICRISPSKAYVEVIANFSAEGTMMPMQLVWEAGKSDEIDRILRVDRCARVKAGGAGIRYVCRIRGERGALL